MWKSIFIIFRECVVVKDINPQYVSTTQQLANLFTKPLTARHFAFLLDKLMVDKPFV